MARHPALLFLLLGLAPGAAAAAAGPGSAAGWECAADVATAYRFAPDRDRWETLVLPVAGQRYQVMPVSSPSRGWQLWRPGDAAPLARCGDFGADGWLRCGADFQMQRDSLVFTSGQFELPAVAGSDLTGATVTGRCTRRLDAPLRPGAPGLP